MIAKDLALVKRARIEQVYRDRIRHPQLGLNPHLRTQPRRSIHLSTNINRFFDTKEGVLVHHVYIKGKVEQLTFWFEVSEVIFYQADERIQGYISGYLHANHRMEGAAKPLFTPKGTAALSIPVDVSLGSYLLYPDLTTKVPLQTNTTLLFGQMTKLGESDIGSSFHYFIVVFSPIGLFHFLDTSADKMTDRILGLSELGLADLEQQLLDVIRDVAAPAQWATNFDRIFLEYFSSREPKKVSFDLRPIVADILENKGNVLLDSLVDKYGINQRTFQKIFRQQVGIAPKLFCRIIRFNALLLAIDALKWDILSRAVEFGYTDNSHLYKDFKAFLGMTPRQYLNTHFKQNLQVSEAVHVNVYKNG